MYNSAKGIVMATNREQLIQDQILVLSEDERESLYRFMLSLRHKKSSKGDSRPISEIAAELSSQVPFDEWAELPVDGAEKHDHYLYGTSKSPK